MGNRGNGEEESFKTDLLVSSMNNGIIDIESELVRQLSKLGEQKEQRERNVSAWIEGTKKQGPSISCGV